MRYWIEELGQVTEVIEKPNGDFSIIKAIETKDIPMAQTKSSIKNILESKRDIGEIHKEARSIAEENNFTIEMTN